jgi:Flp pilus assembly protein TadD
MRNEIERVRHTRLALNLVAGCAAIAILAGCQTANESPAYTGSIGNSATLTPSDLSPQQALAAVQTWGNAYSKDEKNKAAALNYSAALRAAGQTGQAVAVMRKAAIYHPEDREVLAAFGKALAADGQFREALSTVRRAQRTDNPDWQLLSTEGGILDSLDQHEEARARYRQALVLAPGEPQILNNLGLSYLLTNELAEAEKVLREAAASPRATLKVKQNLALVLRLQGKGAEASRISGAPDTGAAVPANAQTAGQENSWAELAKI